MYFDVSVILQGPSPGILHCGSDLFTTDGGLCGVRGDRAVPSVCVDGVSTKVIVFWHGPSDLLPSLCDTSAEVLSTV